MRKLLLALACAGIGSLTAMEAEKNTLIGKDGQEVLIDRKIAKKIPTMQTMLESGLQEAQTGVFKFTLFDAATLQSIINLVEHVYTQAPVLKLDPKFFEQTDKHQAYTPADIPEQVRNIIQEQGLQNNKLFMQAADFLGLDWIESAMQSGSSIADLIVYNRMTQIDEFNGLDLRGKNIISIAGISLLPQDIVNNVQILSLDYNKITSIPDNAFAGLNNNNLQALRLSGNQITSISDNAFAGLNNLQALVLSGNQITSIPDNAFAGLNSLQGLWLNRNRITSIPDNTFAGLNNLQGLWLSGNQITSIPDNAFTGLNNLQELWLDNNQITSISDNAFTGLNNLQSLWLKSNQITSIPDNAFAELNNLQSLGLNGNKIPQATKDRIRQLFPNARIYF